MQRTRLASVPYLNALPLTWGLSRGRHRDLYDLTTAPPFECARRLQDGMVDVALIPSIEFARISGLTPVPGTGISSRNEVRSVLLVSRVPPASIRTLAVDLNSRTSVALARLILGHRYRCRPRVEPMPPELRSMLRAHDAALLIGDAALKASTDMQKEPAPYVLDLAREWNEMTGMPFVFAIWACRPVLDVGATKEVLEQSLEEGLMHLDRIAEEESGRTGLPSGAIASYLRHNIQYHLGRAESDSLRVFYRMSREEGLLSACGASADLVKGTSAVSPSGPSAHQPGTTDGIGKPSALRPPPPRGR